MVLLYKHSVGWLFTVHLEFLPERPTNRPRTFTDIFCALFYITANLHQSVTGGGGTKITFTSSPNGHPSPRHPLIDDPGDQSLSTPGSTNQLHQSGQRKGMGWGNLPSPLFWKCLDAGRPVTREVTTLYSPCCQSPGLSRIQFGTLAPTRDGPAVPVLAAFAMARGPISEPALLSQPGTLGPQPGARMFPFVAALLRVPGRADTGVGGAESLLGSGRGWRLLRWNRLMPGPPCLCDSRLQPSSKRSLSSPLRASVLHIV